MTGWLEILRGWFAPSRPARFDDCLDTALDQLPLQLIGPPLGLDQASAGRDELVLGLLELLLDALALVG